MISATLKVLHCVSVGAVAEVDVYLTAGTDITSSDPAIPNITYTSFVENVYVAGSTYFVTVRAPSSKTPFLGPKEVTLEGWNVYKVIATNGGIIAGDITE